MEMTKTELICKNCGMPYQTDHIPVDLHPIQKTQIQTKEKWFGLSIIWLWLSVLLISIFSPDLVSGSEQESLPLNLYLTWIWGLLATTYLISFYKENIELHNVKLVLLVISGIWLVTTFVSIFAPVYITGSDPTRLPILSLLTPIIAVFLTRTMCVLVSPSPKANNY